MAREDYITRTMKSTEVKLLCMDIETAEAFNTTVILPKEFNSNDKIMKLAKPMVETETKKVVAVVDTRVITGTYRMPKAQFVEEAEFIG